jgi:hypothetical protein
MDPLACPRLFDATDWATRRHRQEVLKLEASLYTLLQVLSVTVLEELPLDYSWPPHPWRAADPV